MKCPKCSEANPADGQFCRRCGAELQATPRRSRLAGGIVVATLVGVLLLLLAALGLLSRSAGGPRAETALPAVPTTAPPTATAVRVGVAFGTEKRDWFDWAVAEFARTAEGRDVQIDLKPMGSLEAAQAIVKGDASIQVWSPASALYKKVFLRDYAAAHGGESPLLSEQPLALTPMVFVMWQERYDAFVKRYPEVSVRTVAAAMGEPGGWNTIAGRPEWGFFKFSHTHPSRSNSGLVALVLMAYDHHDASRNLSLSQITDPSFQRWLAATERDQVGAASGLIESTGTLMNAMVQRGWSTYDSVMVYESNAIDRLRQANGRWGDLRVVYPARNFWNDHPYYVLNVPSSSPAQRRAAQAFADFLLTEPAQREAMAHGFRPANVNVPTNGPDSPFVLHADVGVKATVPGVFCEPPDADVLEALQVGWQRSQAGN